MFPRSVNRRRLIGAVLIFSCVFTPVAQAQTAITDANIDAAVTAWIANPTTATTTYGNIVGWNTASVTTMASQFSSQTFNDNIASWNVASVTSMNAIFSGATAFNQNIGRWNVAAVSNLRYMFAGAVIFNSNIVGWNTAAVTLVGACCHVACCSVAAATCHDYLSPRFVQGLSSVNYLCAFPQPVLTCGCKPVFSPNCAVGSSCVKVILIILR